MRNRLVTAPWWVRFFLAGLPAGVAVGLSFRFANQHGPVSALALRQYRLLHWRRRSELLREAVPAAG